MADKKPNNIVSKSLERISNMISNAYSATTYTDSDTRNAIHSIRTNMDTTIDSLLSKNNEITGVSLSSMYVRVQEKNDRGNKAALKTLEETLSNDGNMSGLLSTYMDNKYIRDLDNEIDTILKYMPQLKDALELKKDSVLSADDFSKDFISIITKSAINDDTTLNARIEELEERYNISEFFDESYSRISYYGEDFVYTPPYSVAIATLLNNRNKPNITKISSKNAANKLIKEAVLNEEETDLYRKAGIEVTYSNTYVPSSLLEAANQKMNKNSNKIIPDELEFEYSKDSTKDGLVTKKDTTELKIPGCILKRLERQNVLPIYIDDICLGYYYVEANSVGGDLFEYVESIHDPMSGIKNRRDTAARSQASARDEMLKKVSGVITDGLDARFVQSNQDLKKEIYLMLKHNASIDGAKTTKVNISYIPPEHITHLYFKKDSKTHRGISEITDALIPAKLYIAIYISGVISVLTRGQDKRAFYIKTQVDSNIAETLNTTINQLKKGNFGLRELNSLNTIFGVVGKFNDMFIPVSSSGEKPLEMEIINGQDVNTNPELMEKLEEISMRAIKVPPELADASKSVEYATRLVMTNAKFLRHVVKRQALIQKAYSKVYTKIYNYEYMENEIMKVLLPPPSHLNLTNLTDLYSAADQLSDNISGLLATAEDKEDENFMSEFKAGIMKRYLTSFVDWDTMEAIKKAAKLKTTKKPKEEE